MFEKRSIGFSTQPSLIAGARIKDASITLRVYAHWLPDVRSRRLVDTLDDAAPRGPQTAPAAFDASDQIALSALNGVVSRVGIEPTTRR